MGFKKLRFKNFSVYLFEIRNYFLPFILLFFINFSYTIFAQDSLEEITSENNFSLEIRYATINNFIGESLYECAKCLLRPEVAQALIKANNFFNKQGYRIKIYDCYRPFDVQVKMWKKVPRATYVANPSKGGSIHNKAAAVDITLETIEGCFVDMGTDYDYFGIKAHIDYTSFSEEILKNRKTLIEGMRKFGFQTIRTEWWHFSYSKNGKFKILNQPLPCGSKKK